LFLPKYWAFASLVKIKLNSNIIVVKLKAFKLSLKCAGMELIIKIFKVLHESSDLHNKTISAGKWLKKYANWLDDWTLKVFRVLRRTFQPLIKVLLKIDIFEYVRIELNF
jgi:hypothetical protein